MTPHPGHSVLLVPVPELEPFVRARTAHYDPSYVSADPDFVHAHVTALGPFLRPESLDTDALARVAEIARATEPFDFVLSRVATFPNGIVHLRPDPDDAFRRLTAALTDAFPDHPPYGGQFPDVVPHLTLDAVSDGVSDGMSEGVSEGVSEESTRRAVAPWTPAHCRAERLDLAWYEPHRCRVLRSWRLGATVAGP